MLLERVWVEGYRCIHSLGKDGVAMSDLLYLIGPNNSGKSSFICALELLLEGGSLSSSDFYSGPEGSAEEVKITATVSGVQEHLPRIAEEHRKKLDPLVKDDQLTFQLTGSRTQNRTKLGVMNPESGEFTNPSGIDNALRSLLPEPIKIESFKDPSQEINLKSTAALGRLLKQIISPVQAELGNVQEHMAEIQAILNGLPGADDKRSPSVVAVQKHLQERIDDVLSSTKVRLQFDLPSVTDFASKVRVEVLTYGEEWHDSSQQGQGFQRILVFALLMMLCEIETNSEGSLKKPYLLLFEEPESFLHPQLQRQLASALKTLSGRNQVVASTHSPIFVSDPETIGNTILARNDTCAKYRACDRATFDELSANQQLQILSLGNTAEYLFTDFVLVAEGISDRFVLEALLRHAEGMPKQRERLAVIASGDKSVAVRWQKLLRGLGLDAKVLVDLDYLWNGAGQLFNADEAYSLFVQRFLEGQRATGNLKNGSVNDKKQAASWLGENLAEERDALRDRARNEHKVWILRDGELEDYIGLADSSKGKFVQYAGRLLKGEEPPQELADVLNWLIT